MRENAHPAPGPGPAADRSPDAARHTEPVLQDAEPRDEAALPALFEACEDWFTAATGLPSAPGDVQSLWYALPDGADGAAAAGKRILVAEADGTVAGVVDAVVGHPAPDTVAVGLFLLAPWARRAGRGTALAVALGERARAAGVRKVTVTVPAGWAPGEAFLASLGFTLGPAREAPGPAVGNRRAGPGEGGVALRPAELLLHEPPAPGRP